MQDNKQPLRMKRPASDDVWSSPMSILSKFDVDRDGFLNFEEFRALCVELFSVNEVKENEQRVRKIFELFDTDSNGILDEQKFARCYEWIHATINPVNVLLIVDVQNDFIDGNLALRNCGYGQDGADVIEPINNLLRKGRWDKTIYTQDWHPENHISFFDNVKMRKFHPKSKVTKETVKLFDTVVFLEPHVTQTLWPKHCVMNTWGAELHKDLLISPSSERVYKGRNPDKDMYSAFGNDFTDEPSDLEKILSNVLTMHVYICGLALDICVKETALNGLRLGYRLAVIEDCCRSVNPDNSKIAIKLISENDGLMTNSDHALSLVNEGKRSLVMAYRAAKKMIQRESTELKPVLKNKL